MSSLQLPPVTHLWPGKLNTVLPPPSSSQHAGIQTAAASDKSCICLIGRWLDPASTSSFPPPGGSCSQWQACCHRPGAADELRWWQELLHSPDAPHATSAREPQESAMQSQEFGRWLKLPAPWTRRRCYKPRFFERNDTTRFGHRSNIIFPLPPSTPEAETIKWKLNCEPTSRGTSASCHHRIACTGGRIKDTAQQTRTLASFWAKQQLKNKTQCTHTKTR